MQIPKALLFSLCIVALLVLAMALLTGSGTTSPAEVLSVMIGGGDGTARDIVLRIRLPRALAAFGWVAV